MSYQGVISIPPDVATSVLKSLAPIMDLVAAEPRHSSFSAVERQRWEFWRIATIMQEALKARGKDPWPASPADIRYDGGDPRDPHRGRAVWLMRCGRPTKKGKPCSRKIRFGRAHCKQHSTEEEEAVLRIWQDRVHLPFTRALGGDVSVSPVNYEHILAELQNITEETS